MVEKFNEKVFNPSYNGLQRPQARISFIGSLLLYFRSVWIKDLKFWQIHLAIWTNIFGKLNKLFLQFRQVHFRFRPILLYFLSVWIQDLKFLQPSICSCLVQAASFRLCFKHFPPRRQSWDYQTHQCICPDWRLYFHQQQFKLFSTTAAQLRLHTKHIRHKYKHQTQRKKQASFKSCFKNFPPRR